MSSFYEEGGDPNDEDYDDERDEDAIILLGKIDSEVWMDSPTAGQGYLG